MSQNQRNTCHRIREIQVKESEKYMSQNQICQKIRKARPSLAPLGKTLLNLENNAATFAKTPHMKIFDLREVIYYLEGNVPFLCCEKMGGQWSGKSSKVLVSSIPSKLSHSQTRTQTITKNQQTTYLTQVKKSKFGQFSSSWAMEKKVRQGFWQQRSGQIEFSHLVVAEQSWWFIAACSLLSQWQACKIFSKYCPNIITVASLPWQNIIPFL